MSNDRISALETAFTDLRATLESKSETRDRQIGVLATELAGVKAELAAAINRVERVELTAQPASLLSVWGPVAAGIGLVTTLGGSFLTLTQRAQDARLDSIDSRVATSITQTDLVRADARFLDSQIRLQDHEFRNELSVLQGRESMLEKQVEAMDRYGPRKLIQEAKE